MSAWVLTPKHIATCAKAIDEILDIRGKERADIAETLARENLASVAFRYGPEGEELYSKLFGHITERLEKLEEGHVVEFVTSSDSDFNLGDMIPGDLSVPEYIVACRNAEPLQDASEAEQHQYLSCLNYQSCEHPQWQESDARAWIVEAQSELAYACVQQILGDRHVWTID